MNKKILYAFFGLLAATAGLASCEQCGNVTINSPTPADSEWLVYKQQDTVFFKTGVADTIKYARTGIYAENIPGEGFSADDECIEKINVQVRTVMEDVKDVQPYFGTRILSKPDDLVVALFVGERSGDKAVETGLWEIDEQSPLPDSTEVNGKWYHDVFQVSTTDVKPNSVKGILFNKEFGFLKVTFADDKVLERIP